MQYKCVINVKAGGKLVAVADLHVEWIVPRLAAPINSHIVASVCLVDVNVALLCHVVEVLCRVHTLAQGGGPGGGIHPSPLVLYHRKVARVDISVSLIIYIGSNVKVTYLRRLDGLPVHHEGNGVLGLRNAVVRLGCCNAGRSRCNDASRVRLILQHPCTDVNVVGRQVVADLLLVSPTS